MTKKLTPKERKFAENYATTGNQAQSIIDAGYNIGSKGGKPENQISIASQMGANKLKKVEIQRNIEEILNSEGITKREIVRVMKELLFSQDKRVQVAILEQLHKIEGNYKEAESKLVGLFAKIESISMTPEEESAEIERQKADEILNKGK